MNGRLHIVILLTFSAVLLSIIFLIPLNSDGDLYQAMATDLVRYGKFPYTGSWDQNFPGVVYLHALSIILFGNSDAGFRLVDLACNLFICYALYRISFRVTDSITSIIAPLVYIIYYVSGGWWAIGQRDVFACAFLLGATLIESKKAGYTILQGILIGCAAMIRPTYGLFLLLVILVDRNWQDILRRSIGFAIPIALLFLPYLFTGTLNEVYLAIIAYNSTSYATIGEPCTILWDRTTLQWIILFFALIGSFFAIRNHAGEKITYALIGSLTGLVSLLVMRKFFVYHFHVLFSFLIPLAVVSIHEILRRFESSVVKWGSIVAIVLLLFVSFYPRHLVRIFFDSSGSITSKVTGVQMQHSIDSSFGRAIDRRLSSFLKDDKNVEIASVTPAVHWMNELDRPSRFTMIHPLTITGMSGTFTDFQERWRQEYLDSLRRRRPERIVLADGPQMLMRYIRRSPKDLALEIPGFAQLLNEHYILDTIIGGYNVYTRNIP